MANSLPDEQSRSAAMLQLSHCGAGEMLAYVKHKRARLMANISWYVDDTRKQIESKIIPVSGILACPQEHSPEINWRERPAADARIGSGRRSDRLIEPEPFIYALKLHRYIEFSDEGGLTGQGNAQILR